MKKLLAILMVVGSSSGYAQIQTAQSNIGVSSDNHLEVSNTAFRFLPFTINVTNMINRDGFENMTIDELKLSLVNIMGLNGNFDDFRNESTSAKALLTSDGDILSIYQKRLYIKGEEGSFKSIEFIKLNVSGMFNIEDQVYVQLEGNLATGLSYRPAGLAEQTLADSEAFYDSLDCANCRQTGFGEGDVLTNYVSGGVNLKVAFRKFTMDIYVNQVGAIRDNYTTKYTEDTFYTDEQFIGNNDNHYSLMSFGSYREVGVKLNYDVVRIKNFGDLSLFISYELLNQKRRFKYSNSLIEANSPTTLHRTGSRTGRIDMPGTINKTQGMLEAGVRLNINFKKKRRKKVFFDVIKKNDCLKIITSFVLHSA